jgi:hypothetical protein
MYIIPEEDYLLVKLYEEKQEKEKILIIPNEKKQQFLEVVKGNGKFGVGAILIPHPHKPKFPVKDDAWLIHQDDIIGRLEF